MKRFTNLVILVCSLSVLYGCAAVLLGAGVVGIGAYTYIEGDLVREYPLSYSRAWDATNSALENLQISISNSMDEGGKGKIEAVRKDGEKVVIKINDAGQKVSIIAVRVGMLGDRSIAESIHEAIASVSGVQ
jgi:hypothetical protein